MVLFAFYLFLFISLIEQLINVDEDNLDFIRVQIINGKIYTYRLDGEKEWTTQEFRYRLYFSLVILTNLINSCENSFFFFFVNNELIDILLLKKNLLFST